MPEARYLDFNSIYFGYDFFSGVLTIRQVDLLDEGTYICEASNDNIRPQRRAVSVIVLSEC